MADAVPLVFNPRAAGGRGARVARRAAALLEAGGVRVSARATARRGEAADAAAALAEAGEPRILACGGDGTLSEVADGVLRSGRRPEVGFLPGGTGNSFLRHFGLHALPDAAARVLRGEARPIDAAVARWGGGERRFINVFGTGFIAHVADRADRRLKALGGAAYPLAVLPEVARLRAPRVRLALDDAVVEEPLALVAVCNTTHTGGAMRIAPDARPDDGWLDVVALRQVGRAGLLRLFPRIFDGSHVGHPRVLHARARRVRIEPSEPSPLLGDGEIFGGTPVEIEVLPAALRLLA